jgi:mono/diheme cytochrome c family protein
LIGVVPIRTLAVALWLLATIDSQARAQKAGARKAAMQRPVTEAGPSTLLGVYTKEQAARGRDVYLGSCKSCHAPASHTSAMFKRLWVGKPLSNLFVYVTERMPKNDPGSLAPEDVADVVSYLLQLNAMPPGSSELPPDVDSLKKFQIELKKKGT